CENAVAAENLTSLIHDQRSIRVTIVGYPQIGLAGDDGFGELTQVFWNRLELAPRKSAV
ncbi:unnamed protein product, partial [marine sediment metagenome]